MMILNLEPLKKFDNENLHLQLSEPPPNAHARTKAKRNGSKGVSCVVLRAAS